MSTVAKNSFRAFFFLGSAGVLVVCGVFPIGAVVLAWLGIISLLNPVAHKLPFPRAIHWLYAMTFESIALCYVNTMRFVPVQKTTKGKGRPILLVHGYVNDGTVWRLQKKRLEALGVGPIYTVDLGKPFGSIRNYVEKVNAKAQAIAEETGRKDLILIGHSMGGLVSCLYATQLPEPNPITDIITIGSPFIGTPIAKIAPGKNAREMEPGSLLLKEIRQAIGQNKTIRFRHIASRSDQLVIPGDSAVLPHHQHFIFEDIGHASLAYSSRVTSKLYEWLSVE